MFSSSRSSLGVDCQKLTGNLGQAPLKRKWQTQAVRCSFQMFEKSTDLYPNLHSHRMGLQETDLASLIKLSPIPYKGNDIVTMQFLM